MTPLENKKYIIKHIFTPFFKSNGFTKKGVKYFKDIKHFKIVADIQSLRYRKIENEEEFRLNIKIFLDTSYIHVGGYCIPSDISHITIDENTNIQKLILSINNDFKELINIFEKYNNVENIIQEQLEEINLLEERIIETKLELDKETENKNLIYVLKNTLYLYEEDIIKIKEWINSCK